MMYDCDSEMINYYDAESCDGTADRTETEDDLSCDGMNCDYAVVTVFANWNGTCNSTYYADYAFAMGCVSVEMDNIAYNLELTCDGGSVMADLLISPCGMSSGASMSADLFMPGVLGTSCYNLTCYEAETTLAPTSVPTEDVDEGDASCMLSVGGMTVLFVIIGLVQ